MQGFINIKHHPAFYLDSRISLGLLFLHFEGSAGMKGSRTQWMQSNENPWEQSLVMLEEEQEQEE